MKRKIAFLHTADTDAEIVAEFGGFNKLFEELLAEPNLELTQFNVYQGSYPAALGDFDGYLIPGALNSANDPEPWIDELMDRTRAIQERGIPLVGVCFGHQLLGRAFGGAVRASEQWEIGMHSIEWSLSDTAPGVVREFFADRGTETRIYQVHGEEVFPLPPGAVRLAGNAACQNQAFSIGETVLAIQGHPEFKPSVARYFLNRNDVGLKPEDTRRALDSLETPNDNQLVGQLIRNFLMQ